MLVAEGLSIVDASYLKVSGLLLIGYKDKKKNWNLQIIYQKITQVGYGINKDESP